MGFLDRRADLIGGQIHVPAVILPRIHAPSSTWTCEKGGSGTWMCWTIDDSGDRRPSEGRIKGGKDNNFDVAKNPDGTDLFHPDPP